MRHIANAAAVKSPLRLIRLVCSTIAVSAGIKPTETRGKYLAYQDRIRRLSHLIITISEVIELKKEVKSRFSAELHFHDSCGGQHFSLDVNTAELRKFIVGYFTDKNMQVVFSEDGRHFTVQEISAG